MPAKDSRYDRQQRFSAIGEQGQQRLEESTVLVVGVGALGSVAAELLVRAGVGKVRIVDRDYPELSNLQRQVLYDEADIASGLPKAICAAEKLRRINSTVNVEPEVADVTFENIARLAEDAAVIVDGTDNFETRLLVNDYAINAGIPWIYGGCVGAEGRVMPILPGKTACLTALVPEPPPPGATATCDTAGILGPAVNVVASLQAVEAMKIIIGDFDAVLKRLTVIDLWTNRLRQMDIAALHTEGTCPTCHHREFPWLRGERGSQSAVLCGRNAVQLRPATATTLNLKAIAKQLATVGDVISNPFLLRLAVAEYQITLFADGRAIVSGTEDEATARSIIAKYIGA